MSLVDVIQGSTEEPQETDISVTKGAPPAHIWLPAVNARMLCALADFPEWAAQPRAVAEFLEELNDALSNAGFGGSQDEFGFVSKTSLDALSDDENG